MTNMESQKSPDVRHIKNESRDGFRNFLIEGQEWCGEQKVNWAKIKTIELTKAVIVFNLGILAFLGAMHEEFLCPSLLFVAVGSSVVSILLAFVYLWKVSTENINYLQAKYDAISGSLKKIPSNFEEGASYYQQRMEHIEKVLRGKERFWDWFQKISFVLFFVALLFAIVGLFA